MRRACLVEFSDEAAETVARDEQLAVQLEARRGRGVVGLEPLLDGAALIRVAIYLRSRSRRREGEAMCGRVPKDQASRLDA